MLLTTYAAWALWLLALPMWWGYLLVMGGGPAPPYWFPKANPVWLLAAPYFWPNAVRVEDYVAFLAVSVIVSAAFITVATTQLRRVSAAR